ncbi:MAG: aspartate kinase [Anaerolineae bacterium]|nr:aspartate kinase [Anaerolineae bacterium]
MRIRTMKFGGTSVGDGEAIRRTAELIGASVNEGHAVVAVVSAMSGVTDALIRSATSAEMGQTDVFRATRLQLLTRHLQAISACVPEGERESIGEEVSSLLDLLLRLCESVSVLGELTARGLDAIIALGERMSCRIVAGCLRGMGFDSVPVEATRLVITDACYGSANPLLEETRQATRDTLLPLLEAGTVPVVTGFLGATRAGVTTTLGRGGSDYSGSLIGAALSSEEIWIWTDVDGVLTADPRIVPEARSLPEISYAEAAELAYFGAKVLHPKTMLPAQAADIPIRIKNTFNPSHPGTLITARAAPSAQGVRGITSVRGLSLVTVQGRGMLGVPGIAAKVFTAVAREGISVLVITQSSSEQNICFVVPGSSAERAIAALEAEFAVEKARHDIDDIWAQNNVGVVAVVGAAMKGTPGIAARVFDALGSRGINVICIAQGSSEHNLSFVLDEADIEEAVRAVHDRSCLGRGEDS